MPHHRPPVRRRARGRPTLLALLLCGALLAPLATARAWQTDADAGGVETLTGSLRVDLAGDDRGYVLLLDLTPVVRRDFNLRQPNGGLALTPIDHGTGEFAVALPAAPNGVLNDVGQGQGAGSGVQLYSLDWFLNRIGDPFVGPWEFQGWSWTNTSLLTDRVTHELIGGRIAVWAPDANQFFPTDLGADGKLFTADDPVGPLKSGWTVVDLDARPFGLLRSSSVEVAITANEEVADDLTQLPATEAFDRLVELLRARYPFADVHPIDWDGLREKHRPDFERAEQTGDRIDFWVALNRFLVELESWQFFSTYPFGDYFVPQRAGSTGLHVETTDDGQVIVVKVEPGQPAELAGIRPGAEIVAWNGQSGAEALAAVPLMYGDSTPQARLYHRTIWFGRAPIGARIPVTYRNPDGAETSVELVAIEIPGEQIDRGVQCYRAVRPCPFWEPGIDVLLLPSGVGYVRVRRFDDNPLLVSQAWEQALSTLPFMGVRGLIVDVSVLQSFDYPLALYLAGSFADEPFPVADMVGIDAQGQPVYEGTLTVAPTPARWDGPVAITIDAMCKAACELFVLAASRNPDVILVGMDPTGGSLGRFGTPIDLPTENFVQPAVAAYRDPVTGAVLIQGIGIAPTLKVPRTPETLVAMAEGDPVRDAAEAALLERLDAEDAAGA